MPTKSKANLSRFFIRTLWKPWLTNPYMRHNHEVSPVTRLPPEVLGEIFMHACDMYVLENEMPRSWVHRARQVMMAPFTITHVCKRWQSIANTTPSLWRNLVVCLTPATSPHAGEYIEEFIQKSGPYTINICFFVTNQEINYSSRDAEDGGLNGYTPCPHYSRKGTGFPWDMFKDRCWSTQTMLTAYNEHSMKAILSAVKHSQKWRTAHFAGDLINYAKFLAHIPTPLKLTKLIGLDIRLGQLVEDPNILFEYAYHLRDVRVTQMTADAILLPWSLITRLHIRETVSNEIFSLLSRCARLSHLIIEDLIMDDYDYEPTEVTLSTLQHLTISLNIESLFFMDDISTPSLVHLTFSYDTPNSPTQSLCVLHQFLKRSVAYTTLQHLELDVYFMHEQDLIKMLRQAKSLVNLNITVKMIGTERTTPSPTATFLSEISNTNPEQVFLPNLQDLTLFGFDFILDELLDALHKRLQHINELPVETAQSFAVLKSVHIHTPCRLQLSIQQHEVVGILRDDGMEFRLNELNATRSCGCLMNMKSDRLIEHGSERIN